MSVIYNKYPIIIIVIMILQGHVRPDGQNQAALRHLGEIRADVLVQGHLRPRERRRPTPDSL